MSTTQPNFGARRVDRRTAIKWMLTASTALAVPLPGLAQPTRTGTNVPPSPIGPATPVPPLPPRAGYGTDPDLMRAYQLGDYWPLTFTAEQRALVAVLCDLILPEDAHSPAASAVGVPDFIDEWISAPYATQEADRIVLLEGLQWIEAESQRRYGRDFREAGASEQAAICDDICGTAVAPELAAGATFFNKLRYLTMGAFYCTPEGMRDLRYVVNLPSQSFEGPPPEVLQQLGLTGSARGADASG